MEKVLRKIFNDPDQPMNQPPEHLSTADELTAEREEALLELREKLSPEQRELLEQFTDISLHLQGEYEYIAFCAGVRYLARLLAEIFCD